MSPSASPVFVIQHTSGEFLGLMEDHLEGRGIRFVYSRPFTADGKLPATLDYAKGLILLGGGPWGTGGGHSVPTLGEEIELTQRCLERGIPVVGIGLGAQILAMAAGGGSARADLRFEIQTARRIKDQGLNGFLPETYLSVTYMRDRPLPPENAEILALNERNEPALFQIGSNCLGFEGHPGAKVGMIEDLLMEFSVAPEDPNKTLDRLRSAKTEIEDTLVPIMTGLVQVTGLMGDQAPTH